MGRARLKMELIADKKSRNTTFNNRREGLIKKIYELTTLCEVRACMIIYGPKQDTGFTEPKIWSSTEEVGRFITDIYKPTTNKDSGSNKTVGLCYFFKGRKRKIEGDLDKLRKKNMEAKYPTRPEIMNIMTEARVREFAAFLRNKLDHVKSRIEFLSSNKERTVAMNLMDPGLTQSHYFNNQGGIESDVIQHYPAITPHQQLDVENQNTMVMLWMNAHDDRCLQFGGGPSSNNTQCQAAGHGSTPLSRHYGPSLPVQHPGPYMQMFPVVAPPYMQMMPAVAVPPQWPQLQLWTKPENDGGDQQEDVVTHNRYQMNHKRARYYNQ